MGHCFSHLTKTDRYKLEAALLAKEKPQAIADRLHVHVSTIYREIKRARMIQRNSDWTEEERYNPDEAHRKYRENLEKKGAGLKIGNDRELADFLEKKVVFPILKEKQVRQAMAEILPQMAEESPYHRPKKGSLHYFFYGLGFVGMS